MTLGLLHERLPARRSSLRPGAPAASFLSMVALTVLWLLWHSLCGAAAMLAAPPSLPTSLHLVVLVFGAMAIVGGSAQQSLIHTCGLVLGSSGGDSPGVQRVLRHCWLLLLLATTCGVVVGGFLQSCEVMQNRFARIYTHSDNCFRSHYRSLSRPPRANGDGCFDAMAFIGCWAGS